VFLLALNNTAKGYMTDKELLKRQCQLVEIERKQSIKILQDACPHLAGSLSKIYPAFKEADTCIVWHKLNTGVWIGICQECYRQFWPEDSDYKYWFNKVSYSTRSESGQVISITEEEWNSKEVQKEIASQFNDLNSDYNFDINFNTCF
jgi:uncharacterized protein with PIN domain